MAPAWSIRQEYGLREGRCPQLVLSVMSSARVNGEMCPLFHSTPKEDVNLGVTTWDLRRIPTGQSERPNGEKIRLDDTHSSLWINQYLKLNLLNLQLQ